MVTLGVTESRDFVVDCLEFQAHLYRQHWFELLESAAVPIFPAFVAFAVAAEPVELLTAGDASV